MYVLDFEDIQFEIPCFTCSATGLQQGGKPCPVCRGVGYNPTTHGDQLLAFLEHQGFLKQQNTTEENI